MRSSWRALGGRLAAVGAPGVDVKPMLGLTRAVAGVSRDHAGVRVVRLEDVAAEVVECENVLDPSTAQRLAASLGRVLRGPGSSETTTAEP